MKQSDCKDSPSKGAHVTVVEDDAEIDGYSPLPRTAKFVHRTSKRKKSAKAPTLFQIVNNYGRSV